MKRYPHSLIIHDPDASPVTDLDGNLSVSLPTDSGPTPCRLEANGRGSLLTLEDGSAYVFDSLVQMPKTGPVLVEGTSVTVYGSDERVIGSGKLKRFEGGQLHNRLWL